MKNLKAARVAQGLTQERCAEALGVSVVRLSRWENSLNDPSVEHRNAIADLLKVTLDELYGRAEFHPTPVTPSEVA